MSVTGNAHLNENGEVVENSANPQIVASALQILSSPVSIDLKTTGDTTVFTPAEDIWVAGIIFNPTAVDTVTVGVTISVGTNASTYNDIISSVGSTTFRLVDTTLPCFVESKNGSGFDGTTKGLMCKVTAGTPIKVHISVGGTATTWTADAYIVGYVAP